jgi:ubiquinone/menaquinone biosynthesis C-methylase UbiE
MEIKNIDYWEKLLKEMPKSYRSWFEDEKVFLQETITRNASVLEVGCGDGRSIKDIIEITQNITGVDHDEDAVQHARDNFREYRNVKILLADAVKLPFKNKSFDFVMCMTTFANFAYKKYKALKEMRRVVKDKGKIIISVFSEDALEERMKIYKSLGADIKEIKGNGTVVFDESLGDNVSEQFSKDELLRIFDETNLRVEKILKSGIGYICKLSKQTN